MSILDGPGEGTWSVYAMKVSEERDAALELAQGYKRTLERDRLDLITQRDEALRELAAMTQVADQQRERAKAAERGAEYLGRVLVELRKVADRGGLMTIAAAEDRAKGGL